jgi:serine protease inhibitor
VVFRADHPFLFFVRDPHTGVLLFAGRLASPK